MTPLGTDFKKRAKWQGSVEEPAAKDFLARKVHTIEWNEMQGTIWNAIKCKERLRSRPEAVVRQATINLYLQVWKSLGDSFPKLYCVDLVEAYVTQENVSSEILREKKRYDLRLPNGVRMRNLWQKVEWGKKARTNSCTRFPRASSSRKCVMCARNMGAHVQRGIQSTKGIKMGREIGFPCS
jgi:hypothetical protein